jgi:hypothetical protein
MAAMEEIELEESTGLTPVADLRPRMDEPPPVRLIAIDDVRLLTPPGKAGELHRFYVDLWQFTREGGSEIIFRAENFRLRFEVIADQKPIERDGVRPIGIEVRSLREAEIKLAGAQIDYLRQRGLLPGQMSLLTQDPAGNWIELFDAIPIG